MSTPSDPNAGQPNPWRAPQHDGSPQDGEQGAAPPQDGAPAGSDQPGPTAPPATSSYGQQGGGYSAPQTNAPPTNPYAPPAQPTTEYGSAGYGSPQYNQPATGQPYGQQPTTQYGQPPAGQQPSTQYGQSGQYGPPAGQQYGAQPTGQQYGQQSGPYAPQGTPYGTQPGGYAGAQQFGQYAAAPGQYPAAPQKSRKNMVIAIVVAVVVIVAAAIGFGLASGGGKSGGTKHDISLPSTVDSYTQITGSRGKQIADAARSGMSGSSSSSAYLSNALVGAYSKGSGATPALIFIGSSSKRNSKLSSALASDSSANNTKNFMTGAGATGISSYPAGSLGGSLRCGRTTQFAACVWMDGSTFGFLVDGTDSLTPAQLSTVTTDFRSEAEH